MKAHLLMTAETSRDSKPTLVRLQKYLASAGFGSRRHCEEYIEAGRVWVDGAPVHSLGTQVDARRQEVRLDGELIKPERKQYFLLNKPSGYLCTNRDPAGRARVIDLFPQNGPRLFTVGRLDENSRGLLLVTNDGELANRLAHPRYRIERKYRVQVAGKPTRETLDGLKRGIHIAEGKCRVRRVRQLAKKGKSTFLELVLTEGNNREIRRMLARVGHKVMWLERIAFGPLRLGRLEEGRYRTLKPAELNALRKLLDEPAERKSTRRSTKPSRPSKPTKKTARKKRTR